MRGVFKISPLFSVKDMKNLEIFLIGCYSHKFDLITVNLN